MEIKLTEKKIPTRDQIVELLNKSFQQKGYFAKKWGKEMFGFVMVEKSASCCVRVQILEDKIKIMGSYRSAWVALLGVAMFLFKKNWIAMEKEVYDVLIQEYPN